MLGGSALKGQRVWGNLWENVGKSGKMWENPSFGDCFMGKSQEKI